MSGRRWIFILLLSISFFTSGCQVDGGNSKMWNPFTRADKDKFADEELPKFVRRISDDDKKDAGEAKTPIAESRVESLLSDGQRALQENRLADAQRAYKEVLDYLPNDATAHHGMAMAADLTENWKEAESHYRQALRERPRDANLLCDMGYSYLLQNRYSEASSYLSQAIQINPNHENAHTNLALLDVRQGNPEAARTRLIQRFGDTAKVTQILAALQSQSGTNAASTLAANTPAIPANATLEEIREIANRERIAAEQRRAGQNIPADYNPTANPVNIASHSNVVAPHDNTAPQTTNPQLTINQQPGQNPANNVNVAGGNLLMREGLAAGNSQTSAGQFQSSTVAQYGTYADSGSEPNTYPLSANANMNPMFSNTASVPTGAWNQYPGSANGMNANPQSIAETNQPNTGVNQQPFTQNNHAHPATHGANSSGVISVRPSGTFQPPTQGVSYGQPIGFSQPAADATYYQNNGVPASAVGNMMHGNSSYANQPLQGSNGAANSNTVAPQNSSYAQSGPQMQLEGLNVGPGSLFPIGQQNGQQDSTLKMGNIASPGSNSIINGAMYGQPTSILPSQEWLMQQQQQIQQMGSQNQMPSRNGQGYAVPMNGGAGNDSSNMNPQEFGNNQGPNQYGNPGTMTAPRPGNQSQTTNPLTAYENQLRQLDNQYNSTLQQLDRNPTAAVPRAQY